MKDENKARDIVQDTYAKLWENLSDVQSTNAKSYMFTIAYNAMIDHLRRDSKQTQFEESNEYEINEMGHLGRYSDKKEVMDAALARLPEQQRAAITLRDYEGYSYEEIGKILAIDSDVVKTYVFRARKHLKKYLVSPDKVI
jgi:RNA polymerase sigma factor (sigma-70 family)